MILLACGTMPSTLCAQTFTTLHSFDGIDGASPQGALLQATDGLFYGTTRYGGTDGLGTVFKMSTSGALTSIASFNFPRGVLPTSPLIQGTDDSFYGTAGFGGGAHDGAIIFKITQSGLFSTLHTIANGPEPIPMAGLVRGTDGNFYGTTSYGPHFGGNVFKISSSGDFRVLHAFHSGANDGSNPYAELIQATDGNFYGTTAAGGQANEGTVFRITPGGRLTILHSFCAGGFPCFDGGNVHSALVQGSDGDLYGTAAGATGYSCDPNVGEGCGTIYKISLAGDFTTLHVFSGADGQLPLAGMILGTDGNFYGVTDLGGSAKVGTLFSITPSGSFTTLYNFNYGGNPIAGLVQGTDGMFYGTTALFGLNSDGTAFSFSVGLSEFIKTLPTAGKVGIDVAVLGTDLTGATSVTFNGVPATYSVASPSLIKAVLPPGATSGPVQVSTPGGTLTSNVSFQVLP